MNREKFCSVTKQLGMNGLGFTLRKEIETKILLVCSVRYC